MTLFCLYSLSLGSAVAQWWSARLETEGAQVGASSASLRCGPWARHIYPSLVQPRKTRPYITERLLIERKESNQTNSLHCGPWARHIYPSLVLVQPRKTCPYITERLLIDRKESNQTNKLTELWGSFGWFWRPWFSLPPVPGRVWSPPRAPSWPSPAIPDPFLRWPSPAVSSAPAGHLSPSTLLSTSAHSGE